MSKKYKGFRAGIIPYHVDEHSNILFMFMKPSDPTYGGEDWQIAKGRFDDGESDAEAVAIREGSEELGLKESNIITISYVGLFRKMYVYASQVKDMEDFAEYDFETGDVCWLSAEEFEAYGREIHRDIVEKLSLSLR